MYKKCKKKSIQAQIGLSIGKLHQDNFFWILWIPCHETWSLPKDQLTVYWEEVGDCQKEGNTTILIEICGKIRTDFLGAGETSTCT